MKVVPSHRQRKDSVAVPELRKDPITGRWVIISTDRAKRPTDFVREPVKQKGGFCPFCPGNESKTPPEILGYRSSTIGGPQAPRDTPGWRVPGVPNKFPPFGIEGNLHPAPDGLYDKMDGVGAHRVSLQTPEHATTLATHPIQRVPHL